MPSDSTHGILIDYWNTEKNVMANIWDFGGQEYYHVAYRLFLSQNAVFVLLWDAATNSNLPKQETLINSKTNEKEEIAHFHYEYWLDNIAHYVPDKRVVFLVQNKVDTPTERQRVSPDLFSTYEILDDHAISLKQGSKPENIKQYRDLENFKTELIEQLEIYANKEENRSANRLQLRDYLIDLQEDTPKEDSSFLVYKNEISIDFETFEKEISKIKIDSFDLKAYSKEVADWLHTKGIVLFYKDNKNLNDKVFLQPKKIVDAIYEVLNKDIKNKYKGQFCLENIASETLYKQTMIDLMEQMEIVFKVEKQGKITYIAPQYLPEEHEIEALYQIAEDGIQQSGFSVKLPLFYYRRALQQLILYYGKNQEDATKSYFWKHGILIQKNGIRLLIKGLYPKINESEGVLTIATDKKDGYLKLQKEVFGKIIGFVSGKSSISGVNKMIMEKVGNANRAVTESINSGGTRKFATETLIFQIIPKIEDEDINKLWLNRFEVSTDGEYFTSYTELLAKAEQNDLKIEGKNKENKTKLLNINNFQMMLDKTVERPLKVFISYAHKDLAYMDDLNTHLRTLRRSQIIETWNDRAIIAGQEWDEKILQEIREADVIIMLMSAYFIDSDYIWEKEIKAAFESKQQGKLVLPIYVKPFDFQGLTWKPKEDKEGKIEEFKFEMAKIQWLPFDAGRKLKAVSKWEDKDDALTEVAKEIRKAIENYKVGKG